MSIFEGAGVALVTPFKENGDDSNGSGRYHYKGIHERK